MSESKGPTPQPADDNGRDARGRFATGNKAGRGNPLNQRTQQIRAALLRAITPQAIEKAAKKLLRQAMEGDRLAFAELLDRTIGRSVQTDVMERLERLETLMAEQLGEENEDNE